MASPSSPCLAATLWLQGFVPTASGAFLEPTLASTPLLELTFPPGPSFAPALVPAVLELVTNAAPFWDQLVHSDFFTEVSTSLNEYFY